MSSPKSPEQSDKNKKYDRQIRLWGEHGQVSLESSQICLINATALGTEILKNTVLPGVGSFTIVDGRLVTEEDLGCNFFVEPSSLGLSLAKCCTEFLCELNPDVSGDYIDENLEHLLQNNPDFFQKFNAVIATDLTEREIIKLSHKLWEINVPFILCRSVGFFGTLRIQMKEHCIIETHPDNKQSDLRIENPFPGLKEHLENTVITSKVPWLVLVYHFLQKWNFGKENAIPKNYKEKCELKELISSAMTKNEENYEEALKAINSCFGGGKANSNVRKIIDDSSCINLNKQSNKFWILARALRDFECSESNGWLPLPGVLPDMTADSASYINLQNLYRGQAAHDADIVYRRSLQLLKELNMPRDLITVNDAKLFCREAANLAVIRGSKIADEYEKNYNSTKIASSLETPDSLMGYYVALRARERFQLEHGHIPGEYELEADIPHLKTIANKLLNDWGITTQFNEDLAHELCRFGRSEIHSISSFMGGCAGHEVIKILTKQYKPIINTFIYEAINSTTETFEL